MKTQSLPHNVFSHSLPINFLHFLYGFHNRPVNLQRQLDKNWLKLKATAFATTIHKWKLRTYRGNNIFCLLEQGFQRIFLCESGGLISSKGAANSDLNIRSFAWKWKDEAIKWYQHPKSTLSGLTFLICGKCFDSIPILYFVVWLLEAFQFQPGLCIPNWK